MSNLIKFQRFNLNQFGNLQSQVSDSLRKYLASGKDFEVAFSYIKHPKSSEQCRALHKLCELLIPRLSESYGIKFDIESVKNNIKWHFGFTRPATIEECVAEAVKIKFQDSLIGKKMTTKEFRSLVNRLMNTLVYPKSFSLATKEEAMELIKKIEGLADKMGWEEVKLKIKEGKYD